MKFREDFIFGNIVGLACGVIVLMFGGETWAGVMTHILVATNFTTSKFTE